MSATKPGEVFRKTLFNYQGHAVGFRQDEIHLQNGRTAKREYMTHPGAVGVLAFPSPGKILMVRQYRFPVKKYTYEIPAGKLDKGENVVACVKRELEEETGYATSTVKKLTAFWPTAAFSDEVIHLFYATKLKKTQAHPDDDEFLDVLTVSTQQVERWIKSGMIQDSKTIIAYLVWKTFYSR